MQKIIFVKLGDWLEGKTQSNENAAGNVIDISRKLLTVVGGKQILRHRIESHYPAKVHSVDNEKIVFEEGYYINRKLPGVRVRSVTNNDGGNAA